MDLSKYPLERLFYFVAGIIPGFIALLIFQVAAPGSFGWFFALGFLGYKTKLSLIVLAAFVVGNSMTAFLAASLGGMGGFFGGVVAKRQSYRPPHSHEVAPWRDPRWRTVLGNRLGALAPNNTRLLSRQVFNLRREAANLLPSGEQRSAALASLNLEKSNTELDDMNWAQWYEHYHQIVLQPDDRDWFLHLQRGLNFNLETAALYVLISALVVPSVRHWWSILPSCLWVLTLVAEEYSGVRKFRERWSTLSAQIKFLAD